MANYDVGGWKSKDTSRDLRIQAPQEDLNSVVPFCIENWVLRSSLLTMN